MTELTTKLFPEWLAAHDSDPPTLPERIRIMRARYGKAPGGTTCKYCAHLLRFRQGTYWFKCELSKITGGQGTDWRAGWPACGKYKESQ